MDKPGGGGKGITVWGPASGTPGRQASPGRGQGIWSDHLPQRVVDDRDLATGTAEVDVALKTPHVLLADGAEALIQVRFVGGLAAGKHRKGDVGRQIGALPWMGEHREAASFGGRIGRPLGEWIPPVTAGQLDTI